MQVAHCDGLTAQNTHLHVGERSAVPHLDTVLHFLLKENTAVLECRDARLGVHIEREEALLVVDAPWRLQHDRLLVALLNFGIALYVWVHNFNWAAASPSIHSPDAPYL